MSVPTIDPARASSRSVDSLLAEASAVQERGDLIRAKALYEAILKLQPPHVEALNRLGMIVGQCGDLNHAVRLFSQAITLDPAHAVATFNMAVAFYNMRRFNAALALFDRVVEINPNFAQAHFGRGNVLRELDQLSKARESFERALALDATNEEFLVNLGNVLRDLGEWHAALSCYDRAIAARESCAEAYQSRGVILMDLQQLPASLENFERAIALRPGYAQAHCSKASALLMAGDFARGWAEYEWRRQDETGPVCKDNRHFSKPLWLGRQPIAGKSILLHSEQGLGDTLQFCRYVKQVADLGARVVLEVPQSLVGLMTVLDGASHVVARGSPLPEFDYQCSLLSLPLALKTTLDTVPAMVPYLRGDSGRSDHWAERLGEHTKLRVGVVWSGGLRPHQPELRAVNGRRNIPLAKLAGLRHPEIEFYSLQKGQSAESELAEAIARNWGGPDLQDFTGELRDFAETAALIEQLDLVISVDTSTAHLAAALGKSVWLLNRFDTCWRWMTNRTDSPWYPTVRLYRQAELGDWNPVVQEVISDLNRLADHFISAQLAHPGLARQQTRSHTADS